MMVFALVSQRYVKFCFLQCRGDKNSGYICINYKNVHSLPLLMELYLFNPETDLALATDGASYTASEKVRQMAHDLAALPLWYAPSGSAILVPDEACAQFVTSVSSKLGKFFFLVREKKFPHEEIKKVSPWGWNRALRNKLLRMGLGSDILPSEKTLEYWRRLSSRTTATDMMRLFKNEPFCGGESVNLYSVADCQSYATSVSSGVVFKSPWSSSGKGLLWCRTSFLDRHRHWCSRVLMEQGAVIAQPIMERICDFAMEFHGDEDGCWRFVGYSLFKTNAQGAYEGNLLLTDTEIENHLSSFIPRSALWRVREIYLKVLQEIDYHGYMGIDMMVCKNLDGAYVIHPCVEMNWRMNMGVLSHQLTELLIDKHVKATFHVENYPSPKALQEAISCQKDKILMQLTPIAENTVSVAYVSAG